MVLCRGNPLDFFDISMANPTTSGIGNHCRVGRWWQSINPPINKSNKQPIYQLINWASTTNRVQTKTEEIQKSYTERIIDNEETNAVQICMCPKNVDAPVCTGLTLSFAMRIVNADWYVGRGRHRHDYQRGRKQGQPASQVRGGRKSQVRKTACQMSVLTLGESAVTSHIYNSDRIFWGRMAWRCSTRYIEWRWGCLDCLSLSFSFSPMAWPWDHCI